MVPVIRIDKEVWEYLQKRALPAFYTPNDVLRKIIGLDRLASNSHEPKPIEEIHRGGKTMNDSIFIVINAAGKVANEKNAYDDKRLTHSRINNCIDIVAPGRFAEARKKLTMNTRIVMHQGGAARFRKKYGAGQLVAAGRVKAPPRELTEKDKQDIHETYELTRECYPDKPLVGIMSYSFPKGIAELPLPKEEANYSPKLGDNFIEIRPDDPRYAILDNWWKSNYGADGVKE